MSQAGKRRGPYAKTAVRRRQILEAAHEVFTESGFAGASLNEIARRSGLTNAGLLHHFDGKEALLEAVLHERDDDQRLSSERWEGSYADRLRNVVEVNATQAGTVRLYSTMSTAATDPGHPANQYFVDRYEQFRSSMAEQIAKGQTAGDLRDDLPPALLATMVLAMMDGLQLQWLLDPDIDMTEPFDAFIRLVEVIPDAGARERSRGDPPG